MIATRALACACARSRTRVRGLFRTRARGLLPNKVCGLLRNCVCGRRFLSIDNIPAAYLLSPFRGKTDAIEVSGQHARFLSSCASCGLHVGPHVSLTRNLVQVGAQEQALTLLNQQQPVLLYIELPSIGTLARVDRSVVTCFSVESSRHQLEHGRLFVRVTKSTVPCGKHPS